MTHGCIRPLKLCSSPDLPFCKMRATNFTSRQPCRPRNRYSASSTHQVRTSGLIQSIPARPDSCQDRKRKTQLKSDEPNCEALGSESRTPPDVHPSPALTRRSTYRELKTQYVKALERDLGIARQREAEAARESEVLNNTVYGLLQLLAQNNIVVPDSQRFGPPPESVAKSLSRRQQGSSLVSHRQTPYLISPVPEDDRPDVDGWPEFVPSRPPPSTRTRVCDLDQVSLGMQFVLR